MKKLFSRAVILMFSLITISSLQGCTQEAKTEIPKKEVLWSFTTGGSILSSPVIFENDVIFGSTDKSLYSVDLSTKEEKWKFESNGRITSTPIIDGNNVAFTTESGCYLLDAKTGKEIWKYESENSPQIGIYDYHSPSPILYKDLIIYTNGKGYIYGINKSDGSIKWEYKDTGSFDVRTTPSIQDNILCYGDIKGNAFAMDLETQKTLWTKNIGIDLIHAAFAYKDYAYFAGRDTKLVAFNLKDGSEKWSYKDNQGSWLTADIIAKDDMLYVGGSDNLRLLTFKYDSGERGSSYNSKSNIFSKPLIENNILYITSGNVYVNNIGAVTAYDLNNPQEKLWETPLETGIYSSPSIKDGVVYFGGSDGKLYAIKY